MTTVLVVEDTLTDIETIKICLQQADINVLTAHTVEEALEQITIHQLDIIILDVVLPDQSGFKFCQELKSDPGTRTIPIILCSHKGGTMDQFWGMKQGADAYLVKPIAPEKLLRTIRQLLIN
ncbi:MAG: response regulator [Symploca sp. SIO2E9]|nr:response regulator [Symploca sp. SIO2E9]